MKGKLIVFEGIDGVGKTTLSKHVQENLNSLGYTTEWFSFPGKGSSPLGELIYDLHHNKSKYGIELLNPISLQLLHISAHIDLIEGQIIPCLKSGKNVVLDRFWWSTWAYGKISKIENEKLEYLRDLEISCWKPFKPDVIVLINTRKLYRKEMDSHIQKRLLIIYDDLSESQVSSGANVLNFNNSKGIQESSLNLLNLVIQELK